MGRGGTGVKAASKTSIEISFTFRGVRCRPRVKLSPTPANLKRAERLRERIIDAIARDEFDYADTFPNCPNRFRFASAGQLTSIADYLEEWLSDAKPHLATSTYHGYRKVVYHKLIPAFGEIALTDISVVDVNLWAQSQTTTNKTINNTLSPLKQALNQALSMGLINHNPLAGWTFSKRQARKHDDDVDPFTVEEQAAILEAAEGQAKNLIQFAMWTGLRTSEYVALNWSDIDFDAGTISVNKAQTQAAKKPEPNKTASGKRTVKMLPMARAALENQKQHTFEKGIEVFQNPRHLERWTGDQPIRKTMWIPIIEQSGVNYRRPYQMRHTYASMMLSAGESPIWVAQQMGHKDWTMIAKIYGRWMPDADPNAGNKAVELFDKTLK